MDSHNFNNLETDEEDWSTFGVDGNILNLPKEIKFESEGEMFFNENKRSFERVIKRENNRQGLPMFMKRMPPIQGQYRKIPWPSYTYDEFESDYYYPEIFTIDVARNLWENTESGFEELSEAIRKQKEVIKQQEDKIKEMQNTICILSNSVRKLSGKRVREDEEDDDYKPEPKRYLQKK